MAANLAVAGQRITAAWLNTNIPRAWQAITPGVGCSLTAGTAGFQARLFNSVTLEIVCNLTIPASSANGFKLGQLPTADLFPASLQNYMGIVTGGTVGQSFAVATGPAGGINMFSSSMPAAGWTAVGFHVFLSLDA